MLTSSSYTCCNIVGFYSRLDRIGYWLVNGSDRDAFAINLCTYEVELCFDWVRDEVSVQTVVGRPRSKLLRDVRLEEVRAAAYRFANRNNERNV